jgi:hypothetical protein
MGFKILVIFPFPQKMQDNPSLVTYACRICSNGVLESMFAFGNSHLKRNSPLKMIQNRWASIAAVGGVCRLHILAAK